MGRPSLSTTLQQPKGLLFGISCLSVAQCNLYYFTHCTGNEGCRRFVILCLESRESGNIILRLDIKLEYSVLILIHGVTEAA